MVLATPSTLIAEDLPPAKPLIQSFSIVADQGMGQNWAVEQGPDGLIYVGGSSSLLIYDGASWRSIKTPDDGRVRDLKIDGEGRIWVASPSQFGYFERNIKGKLTYHSISEELPENERDLGEIRFVRILGDTVYFNSHHRLFRWADDKLTTFDKWDTIFRLAFTDHGRYYVAVKDRIYDLTEFPVDGPAPAPEARWRWPDKARITFLSPWDEDQLLLGTYTDGLYLLGEGEPRRFADDAELVSAWPYKALRLSDGSLVITTIRSGIFHYSSDGRMLEHISADQGLPVNSTLGALVDHEGGLWLAQEGAIARVELASSVRYYDKDANAAYVRALVEHRGHLLTGGGSTALGVLETNAGLARVRELNLTSVQETFDLHSTGQGVLVSGFQGVHLVRLDEAVTTVVASEHLYEDTYSYDLFPSPSRPVIYVESENGLGVLVRDTSGWRALTVDTGISVRPASIAEDLQGRVWVGTGNGRYYLLVWRDAETLQLEATFDAEKGVPPGNAHVFRFGDRLIFGTVDGGYRLTADEQGIEPSPLFGNEDLPNGERDVFRFFSPDQQRIIGAIGPDKSIWRGALQDNGTINWFGPQLRQLDPSDVYFVSEAQGVLWIGHPTRLYRMGWPQANTPLALEGRLNLRWAGFPDKSGEAGQAILLGNFDPAQNTPASLPHSQAALRFVFAMASYARPDKTQYRALLEGHDSEWSKWSLETHRDYTNLAGGDYRFKVQARNVFGAVSESAPYAFKVQPPWYLSPSAWLAWITAGVLLLLLAAWLGQRRRQQRLLATQVHLEQEVAVRTAEVRQQALELRELSEAKSRFFANVSHEFRTPLTLARGPLEELMRGEAGPLGADARRFVGMALRSTETMEGLIGQILDINQLEEKRMPISIIQNDFAAFVRSIVDEFVEPAGQQVLELTVTDGGVPVMADFDPGHMAKVVRNLLANAFKFTPAKGSIEVNCQAADGQIELSITDTGCGINTDDLPRVFERYFQGDQTHANQPGTGIGLALVQELVELHQGSVVVESTAGAGSIFKVKFPDSLPQLQGPAVLAEIQSDGLQDQKAADNQRWMVDADSDDVATVLIVDDNTELRGFLNMRLRGSYRVLEANDGEEGLATARAELPDIVVTDVMMPKMTGLELAAALKSDPETNFIPILMLSARTGRRDTVAGLEQGADDYLAKPFDSAELATRVAGLIASRRKLRQALVSKDEPAPARSVFHEKAHAIAQEQLSDPTFGPRDWASLLHMDRTTLYRKLKAETDLSPEEYLREQRLQRAAEMLKSRSGNVSQVAVAVGFNSISYFSSRFKERFGETPAAFSRH